MNDVRCVFFLTETSRDSTSLFLLLSTLYYILLEKCRCDEPQRHEIEVDQVADALWHLGFLACDTAGVVVSTTGPQAPRADPFIVPTIQAHSRIDLASPKTNAKLYLTNFCNLAMQCRKRRLRPDFTVKPLVECWQNANLPPDGRRRHRGAGQLNFVGWLCVSSHKSSRVVGASNELRGWTKVEVKVIKLVSDQQEVHEVGQNSPL